MVVSCTSLRCWYLRISTTSSRWTIQLYIKVIKVQILELIISYFRGIKYMINDAWRNGPFLEIIRFKHWTENKHKQTDHTFDSAKYVFMYIYICIYLHLYYVYLGDLPTISLKAFLSSFVLGDPPDLKTCDHADVLQCLALLPFLGDALLRWGVDAWNTEGWKHKILHADPEIYILQGLPIMHLWTLATSPQDALWNHWNHPHYHIDRFKRSAKEVTDPFHNGRKPLWIWIPPKDVTAVQQSSSSSSSAGWVRGILVRSGVFWGGEGRMRCPNKDCRCYLHLFTIHFWCLVGCSCTSEMKVKSSWVNNGMKCLPTSAAFQPSKVWYPYFLPKKMNISNATSITHDLQKI